MDEYLGKTCPYCKTVIKADENIIVCSDCGMPHHKECWIENQGCTTFGCLGTIQGVNQSAVQQNTAQIPPQPSEEQLGCFKCGFLNPFSNTFCRKCGARLLKPLGTNGTSPGQPMQNPQGMPLNPGNAQPSGQYTAIAATPLNIMAAKQPVGDLTPIGSNPANGADPSNSQVSDQFNQNSGNPPQAEISNGSSSGSQGFQQPYGNPPITEISNGISSSSQRYQQPYGNPPQTGYSMPRNGCSVNPQSFQQSHGNPQHSAGVAVSEEDFIKDNSQYYRQKFMEMRMENKKISWNWSAWFFNVTWCFYRKMYKVGFIFLSIQFLAVLLSEIQPILTLLTSLALGVFGNHFYMRYTEEALKKAENVPDLLRYTYLRKKGGTSVGAVLLLFGGALFIGFIAGFIIEFLSYMG